MLTIFNMIREIQHQAAEFCRSVETKYSAAHSDNPSVTPVPMDLKAGIEGTSSEQFREDFFALGREAVRLITTLSESQLAQTSAAFAWVDIGKNISQSKIVKPENYSTLLVTKQTLQKSCSSLLSELNTLPNISENNIQELLIYFKEKLADKNTFACTPKIIELAKAKLAPQHWIDIQTNRKQPSYWFELYTSSNTLFTSVAADDDDSRASRLAENLLKYLTNDEIDALKENIIELNLSIIVDKIDLTSNQSFTPTFNANTSQTQHRFASVVLPKPVRGPGVPISTFVARRNRVIKR